jgi:small subunit ribosomal protein S20
MPNTKSAKKRLRQTEVRRERNKSVKSALRSQLRKIREAVEAGDVGKAESELQVATKRLDRAGQKNVIHKNKAARTKSRLQKMIKKAKQGA